MTNQTIKQLKAYCQEKGIEVIGDKRKKITFIQAIDTYLYNQPEVEEVEVEDEEVETIEYRLPTLRFTSYLDYVKWVVNNCEVDIMTSQVA